jgi:hypothetical protein
METFPILVTFAMLKVSEFGSHEHWLCHLLRIGRWQHCMTWLEQPGQTIKLASLLYVAYIRSGRVIVFESLYDQMHWTQCISNVHVIKQFKVRRRIKNYAVISRFALKAKVSDIGSVNVSDIGSEAHRIASEFVNIGNDQDWYARRRSAQHFASLRITDREYVNPGFVIRSSYTLNRITSNWCSCQREFKTNFVVRIYS